MHRWIGLPLLALVAALGPAQVSRPADAVEAAVVGSAHPPQRVAGRAAGATVVAVGDIACAPGFRPTRDRCQHQATADLVTGIDPAKVIVLGDNQYDVGSLAAYRASYGGSWGAFRDRTLPIPGNHEYGTANARGYRRYFGVTGRTYRAANVGTWRVYLLDSNCRKIDCAAQRAWLRADLEAHPEVCSAIALHHPRYSSGSEHGSTGSMARFWRIAFHHGVDLALAGHEHTYERFAAMDWRGLQVAEGITSFVVGTGGRSQYGQGTPAPGSQYFLADRFGVLRLTLGDGEFSWGFKAIGGGVRDAGSAACH